MNVTTTPDQEENQKWLFKNYPIGHRFWYMGTEFIVVAQNGVSKYEFPNITCDYKDNTGRFRWMNFQAAVLKAI